VAASLRRNPFIFCKYSSCRVYGILKMAIFKKQIAPLCYQLNFY
jgi:hypothetical protein